MYTFYEFFAGGGMARAGLGERWSCLFANDFDYKKGLTYQNNWNADHLKVCDVKSLNTNDLPGLAQLVWASFPCQDLSLAGSGAGLGGERSGTFWPFWKLMTGLILEERAPKIIVLENVCGTLTSHGGKDFAAISSVLEKASYRFGALVIDAALFVPQSRPRLFIVAVHQDQPIPDDLISENLIESWHTPTLHRAFSALSSRAKDNWVWWSLPQPKAHSALFVDLVEDAPKDVKWHTTIQTNRLLDLMSDVNRQKVEKAKKAGRKMVGCVYKRTRRNENGEKVQRAEVRFDDIAGCLRTPAGGSSRQLLLIVEGNKVKSRLISTRETARLMGLPDEYKLPENYNEAYHLTGDGVVVPVVRHLATHLFEPILEKNESGKTREAA